MCQPAYVDMYVQCSCIDFTRSSQSAYVSAQRSAYVSAQQTAYVSAQQAAYGNVRSHRRAIVIWRTQMNLENLKSLKSLESDFNSLNEYLTQRSISVLNERS